LTQSGAFFFNLGVSVTVKEWGDKTGWIRIKSFLPESADKREQGLISAPACVKELE
jgi:hypothetical protein